MDNCPFCGADYSKKFADFECKTYKGKSRPWNRGEQCYERQIANLQDKIAKFIEGENEGIMEDKDRQIANLKERLIELGKMHHECCKSNANLKEELELSFKSVVQHHEAQTADLKQLNKSLQVAYDNTLKNLDDCKEQLREYAMKEQLDDLEGLSDCKERLEAWREYVRSTTHGIARKKLQDLGEI